MQTLSMNVVVYALLFDVILLIFMVISMLLIHSLIMIKVETKSFETGIMRMVGVNKRDLILMMLV